VDHRCKFVPAASVFFGHHQLLVRAKRRLAGWVGLLGVAGMMKLIDY
jgi:hypothetical protein